MELLATIVILAILALIAVPNVSSLVRKSKANMFCKKVESIEAAAKYYAQDYLSDCHKRKKAIISNYFIIPSRLKLLASVMVTLTILPIKSLEPTTFTSFIVSV